MKRIQLHRSKGWRLPEGAVSVARPSRYGNPFRVGVRPGEYRPAEAVALYRVWLLERRPVISDRGDWPVHLDPLRDATALACWCPLTDAEGGRVPCHADVLIELLEASA